ncbi:MAG: sugar-binding protein [Leeuwenhoekiella sp.]
MKNLSVLILLVSVQILFVSCKTESEAQQTFVVKNDQQLREVKLATIAPVIDGIADDPAWEMAEWYEIDERWIGKKYSKKDFSGRYTLKWTPEGLYILAEITDDILDDQHPDPLDNFWNDDCLEVFVDEDNSGGDHQYNYNAFAYHIALDGNVTDTSPEGNARLYNANVESAHTTNGNITTWEVLVTIFDHTYVDDLPNEPVILKPNKKMGFAIAYCDNDGSPERENFIGSIPVAGKDKNRGWIDAGIFGTLLLTE